MWKKIHPVWIHAQLKNYITKAHVHYHNIIMVLSQHMAQKTVFPWYTMKKHIIIMVLRNIYFQNDVIVTIKHILHWTLKIQISIPFSSFLPSHSACPPPPTPSPSVLPACCCTEQNTVFSGRPLSAQRILTENKGRKNMIPVHLLQIQQAHATHESLLRWL